MTPKIAVIYYSSTGNVHGLASALARGAESAGAEVRLRRVEETAPPEAVESNEAWKEHADSVAPEVEVATLDDLEWCDGLALGSPTRYGNIAAQLKTFMDTTGGLWAQGKLDGKTATSFTSASTAHGGLESTVLAINNTLYHWGCVIVPLGYAADQHLMTSGNPYGASLVGGQDDVEVKIAQEAAEIQGIRLADITGRLAA